LGRRERDSRRLVYLHQSTAEPAAPCGPGTPLHELACAPCETAPATRDTSAADHISSRSQELRFCAPQKQPVQHPWQGLGFLSYRNFVRAISRPMPPRKSADNSPWQGLGFLCHGNPRLRHSFSGRSPESVGSEPVARVGGFVPQKPPRGSRPPPAAVHADPAPTKGPGLPPLFPRLHRALQPPDANTRAAVRTANMRATTLHHLHSSIPEPRKKNEGQDALLHPPPRSNPNPHTWTGPPSFSKGRWTSSTP
jgi:hypothetical protein